MLRRTVSVEVLNADAEGLVQSKSQRGDTYPPKPYAMLKPIAPRPMTGISMSVLPSLRVGIEGAMFSDVCFKIDRGQLQC